MPALQIRYLLRLREALERRATEDRHSRLVYRGIPYSPMLK